MVYAWANQELLYWVEPNGTVHRLSYGRVDDVRIDLAEGLAGFYMPDFEFTRDNEPLVDGSVTRHVRAASRELEIPIAVRAPNRAVLRQTLGQMLTWFDPRGGEGTLRVVNPDQVVREARARYVSGLEARGADGRVDWQRATIVLWADDPYWHDASDTTYVFRGGEGGVTSSVTLFFPVLPVRVYGSNVYAAPVVENPGHADAWPVWTIAGPADQIVLRNVTTGERLTVPAPPLQEGETLVVDTRPGQKYMARGGTDVFPQDSSTLWALRPGANSLEIALVSATAATSVTMATRFKYLGVR